MTLCIQILSLLAVQILHFTDGKAIEVSSLEAREELEDLAGEAALDKREMEDKDNQVEIAAEVEERGVGHEEYNFNNEVKVEMREDDLVDFEEAAEEETEEKREDGEYENSKVEDLDARTSFRKSRRIRFKLVDRHGRRVRGENEGLLLAHGGTVCSDHFTYHSAHAICRLMGYAKAKAFREAENQDYREQQQRRGIQLDDVRCDKGRWTFCRTSDSVSRNCRHNNDIALTCLRRKGL